MTISFDPHRRRAQQTTIVVSLLLAVSAFAFPDRLLVHHGAVVFVALIIMFGRRVANKATALLAVLTVAVFLTSGSLGRRDYALSNSVYYIGLVLSGFLALAYVVLYASEKKRAQNQQM